MPAKLYRVIGSPVIRVSHVKIGNKEVFAIGRNNNGNYLDVLVKSEFSGYYHWIEENEDPKNQELYPHLNEEKDRSYLDDLDGPTNEDLGREAA